MQTDRDEKKRTECQLLQTGNDASHFQQIHGVKPLEVTAVAHF